MIISKTPVRISFIGGGTDIREFYKRDAGAVLSTTINKYIYIMVNRKFDDSIRLSYSKTELVNNVDEIQHEIIKAVLRFVGIKEGIEIVSIADIPSYGTGLGSSSAFTVGLLNSLYAYVGRKVSPETLAQDACRIEIDILGRPIGKQDHYIAAYGGMRHIQFRPDDQVTVDSIECSKDTLRKLQEQLIMFYVYLPRDSNKILKDQVDNMASNFEGLQKLKHLAIEFKECLEVGNGNAFRELGEILKEGWTIKKGLARGISNQKIDIYYKNAIIAGAKGGKLLGAGGGGFLLLLCEKEKQNNVRIMLKQLQETKFKFNSLGSRIIHKDKR